MFNSQSKDSCLSRVHLEVSSHRISQLIKRGIDPTIAKLDLELVKKKLLDKKEGVGWSIARTEIAEVEYKRFLTLHLWNNDLPYPLVPTRLIDMIWHQHILDTHAYHKDTVNIFGTYLHHFPYFGMGDEDDQKRFLEAFEKTKELYLWTFGEHMIQPAIKQTNYDTGANLIKQSTQIHD